MEWGTILALVVGVVVLCTGHLTMGLVLGCRIGGSPPSAAVPLEPFVAAVDRMRADILQLSNISRDVPALDREFAGLIARLTFSLDELHRSLTDPRTTPCAAQQPDEQSHQLGTHAVGNVRILEWFNRPKIGRGMLDEDRHYSFAVKQPLAPRAGEELPEIDDFAMVQCHDLSPAEIRYLVDQRPTEEEVVIGLGLPTPIKYLLARVDDYKSVYMYGRVGFLVTATFVESLDEYQRQSRQQQPELA